MFELRRARANINKVRASILLMPTTIQIGEVTKRRLELLKEQLGMRSYDDVITKLIPDRIKAPKSMAGVFPDLIWNKETDRMKFQTDDSE